MKKSTLFKLFIALPLSFTVIAAQTDTDAIEKARQAKEAAEKAAAEAAAATEAAIEQAAQKAAAEAREEAKRKKEEDEARKIAEQKAAEEAELDAAAARAAEEAKRKMAAELGLEYEDGDSENTNEVKNTAPTEDNNELSNVAVEEVTAKESSGYNLGFSGSFGFLQGEFFDNIPAGGSIVISTPWGFDLGSLKFGLSATMGAYPAKHNSGESFTPLAIGLGGNATLAQTVFTEGHIGLVGDAMGARGFAGISMEKLSKNVNLPFNLLIGAEMFLSTLMKEGVGSVDSDGSGGSGTYWGGLAFRIDYNL